MMKVIHTFYLILHTIMICRESESYVAVKGQSLIVTRSEGQKRGLCRRPSAVALNGPIAAQINMKSIASSDDQLGEAQMMSHCTSNTE
jgi:hypothetical protein